MAMDFCRVGELSTAAPKFGGSGGRGLCLPRRRVGLVRAPLRSVRARSGDAFRDLLPDTGVQMHLVLSCNPCPQVGRWLTTGVVVCNGIDAPCISGISVRTACRGIGTMRQWARLVGRCMQPFAAALLAYSWALQLELTMAPGVVRWFGGSGVRGLSWHSHNW